VVHFSFTLEQKRARRKSEDFAGPRGKKKYTRLTQLALQKMVYRRPPPPPRELLAPRDPPLEGARLEPDEFEEALVRLCTTDGLILTACDLLSEDAALLLPLNLCHPPELDVEVVDPDADEGLLEIADVLPDEVDEGFTRCHPPLPADPVEPAVCALLAAADDLAVLPMFVAERDSACLC
jgi:hypothetical protein